MPLIYEYKCSNCKFQLKGAGNNSMFVKMDDGSEEILAHPLEESDAKKKTGKTIEQLEKLNRIVWRPMKYCSACLQSEFDCKCDNQKWFTLKGLENSTCPVCAQGKINRVMTGVS